MKSNSSPNQPFWIDEPDTQIPTSPTSRRMLVWGVNLIHYSIGFFVILIIAALFAQLGSPVLAWIWVIVTIAFWGFGIYRLRKRKLHVSVVEEIQKRASEMIGANQIGSAIHVAGHPLMHGISQYYWLWLRMNCTFMSLMTPLRSIHCS